MLVGLSTTALAAESLPADSTNTTKTCTLCQTDYTVYLNQTTTPIKAYGKNIPVIEETLYSTTNGGNTWATMSYCHDCTEKKVQEYLASLPEEPDPGEIIQPSGTGDVPVELTSESPIFSVTVPTVLPVTVRGNGEVIVASDVSITNNSFAPVEIRKVTIQAKSPWSLVDFTKSFTSAKVGLQEFGFKVQGAEASASNGDCAVDGFDIINGKTSEPMTYDANVAVQSTALDGEQIASVIFQIDWATERAVVYEDFTLTEANRAMVGYTGAANEVLAIPETFSADGANYRVTAIDARAFAGCTNLKSVTIPDSVTTMGAHIFNGCTALESATLPSGIEIVQGSTFYNCSSLKNISIPDTVTNIATYAFEGCASLESLVIPEGVVAIDNGTFRECTGLKSITLPSTLTRIGMFGFHTCTSLSALNVPSSVTSIGTSAFVNVPHVYYNGPATHYSNWGALALN